MKRSRCFIPILYLAIIQPIFAWNAAGHQLIARLALSALSTKEIAQFNLYNDAYHAGFQPRTLPQAAVWLDWLHCSDASCVHFSKYHYIDYPYVVDGTKTIPPASVNAVFAIIEAKRMLSDRHVSSEKKGLQLRILMHVIGDIHQPMHAISLFSHQFPNGDRGGNAYLLGKNRVAKNLHAYWDRGGGMLAHQSMYHRAGMEHAIKRIQSHYPCHLKAMRFEPSLWAKESYDLARQVAYQLPLGSVPDSTYQHHVIQITEQRLALAGCRLAAVMLDTLPSS